MRILSALHRKLQQEAAIDAKEAILDAHCRVKTWTEKWGPLHTVCSGLMVEERVALKQLISIGQLERILGKPPYQKATIQSLMEPLLAIDFFYKELGGIVGYHVQLLNLLQGKKKRTSSTICSYHSPSFIDISHPN